MDDIKLHDPRKRIFQELAQRCCKSSVARMKNKPELLNSCDTGNYDLLEIP